MLGEPIIGVERVVYDDETGPGALPARALVSPKAMTSIQRAIHDLTHLPYHPGCEICVSTRRPNTHHRLLKKSERDIPLLVGDYCFPKHSSDADPMTVLVIRVYPYKLFLCCVVKTKGHDSAVVGRLVRFIKDCGLTHFTYRSDREPSIMAMFDDACSVSGRHGTKDTSADVPEELTHARLIDDTGDVATIAGHDLHIGEEPHVPSSVAIDATHTAAPELTHPGESQSNGLAERSVGIFEDQFRTLKHALEARLKQRLPGAHPVTAWLVEHTAFVLNKYKLDSDGRTAYGRLHGREGIERICEFGEVVMWFVPKKLRAKLDQRWRYGVFLGRSLSSDQNYVGLNNGDVVCARALVRVVSSIRWNVDRVSKIHTSPITFKSSGQDLIEEEVEPHTHPAPTGDAEESSRQSQRVRLVDADVQTHGYTDGCLRCRYLQEGRTTLAKGVRHTEECRDRIYEALRAAGADKIKRADMTDSSRAQPRLKKRPDQPAADQMELQPTLNEAPTMPMESESANQATPTGIATPVADTNDHDMNEPEDATRNGWDDTHNFHETVDADIEDVLDVDWTGPDLADDDHTMSMSSLVDVLQTLGVTAVDAVAYSVSVVKDRPLLKTQVGTSYNPTFFEMYGQGNVVNASHGRRRNLNVNGLRAFDLRTAKPSGEPWDFAKGSDRRLARQIVEEEKPTWIIGSPPCTFFSAWNQGINHRKMAPERVEELRREAVKHLHFVIGLYRIQIEAGRHFLHEHPDTATSWTDPWMERLMQHGRISTVTSDQCEYGLLTPNEDGIPTPAKKPTRWMSSSVHMLRRLSKRCKGDHEHQHLVGGRAKAAENYSTELITEILRGIRDTADFEESWGDANEKDLDQAMVTAGLMHDVRFSSLVAAYRAEDIRLETQNLMVKFKHRGGRIDPTTLVFKDSYKDEYTNEELPIGHVKRAMQEELEYFCDKVWVGVPLAEAQNDPDGKIFGSRWVNCNKNDINDPDVRCRLVAQEINLQADESFYAATPPLEAKRMLFSEYASEQTRNGVPLQISFVDVKKAYFYGIPDRSLYVRFPPEMGLGKGMVGKLVRCMYGTRDAGAIWENCYTTCLTNMGFVQGAASPCCFLHKEWGVSVVVHGDDFTALGTPEALTKYEAGMMKSFECKIKGRLGTGKDDLKEMRVLNRIVRITDGALLYEADPRHAEMLIQSFQLEESKAVVTPGVKVSVADHDQDMTNEDVRDELHRIISELKCHRKRPVKVKFCSEDVHYDVPAYSTIYGQHPSTFDFDSMGRMITRNRTGPLGVSDDMTAARSMMSPNARRAILENVLRNGSAWEPSTAELVAKVNKAAKKKFTKARIGSKAAKFAERMEMGGDELDDEAATLYRALAARLLYLSMDRPEVAYAAKELCRHFAHPTKIGVEALKRAVRFLVGLPRLVWAFPFQSHSHKLKVYVDTDFGGCQTTRRSTSGGIAMRGAHPIKHWSLTQTTIALSSGEAELSGICRGASIALGLQSLAQDLGIKLEVEILTDATAAIGICRRRGLGKIRHLHVSDLWVQDRLRRGDFALTKVLGVDNPADVLTKHVSKDIMLKHMKFMGLYAETGRATSAPTLAHK